MKRITEQLFLTISMKISQAMTLQRSLENLRFINSLIQAVVKYNSVELDRKQETYHV